MSRCFPYPPPGYALSGASKEALIESIKLQKEREKAKHKEQRKEKKKEKEDKKKEKKDRRKEKKDRRKEKEEKRKEKKDKVHQDVNKSDDVKSHVDKKFLADVKDELLPKCISKPESEQLERSTLTEEHGQTVHLRVPSTSSDSTENSNKRKRQSSPTDVTRGHGKIIRIRLSSKKQNEPDESANEQLCSTSGRMEFTSQESENVCSTSQQGNNIAQDLSTRYMPEQVCSSSQQVDTVAPVRCGIPSPIPIPVPPPPKSKKQKMGMKYQNLIVNWVPPQLLSPPHDDSDDVDWLFRGKKEVREEKRCTLVTDTIPCTGNSTSLWPCAQYLQEIDVFALPYTVPF